MPSASLNGRAVLNVTGEDAEDFLQNLITTDLDTLERGDLKPGALLSPQGKILFEFLVSRQGDGLRLDALQTSADDLLKRLTLYKLRAKVQIAVDSESFVEVAWESESELSETESTVHDRRFPDALDVRRQYGGERVTEGNELAWTALRIAHGVAEAPNDYALGDAFPHDTNLDQTGGVSFKKGCFVGQEVVSRMQHRGTARRRILVATGTSDLPATDTPITANGREIGTLGSIAGKSGLALVRIDRVKDAMDSDTPILAGEIAIHLAIPPEHRFTFPEATQEA
ncbi:YgfZ/GcvT domain-containing protein [Phyllobacterium zundukense]|uniref:Folate-binding protein YgfZ n=1 Tax=Phyllobacterium zundukense TaxID=1867719 RepID=A0A2N9W3L0_9HYPH|nr:folate-binding protein YgfZ [Phyllobacterium zundukense]ATU92193.1 folate-binding protein YgfZ [Phyllobacterium zundukense]PIO46328.1 folate-binding protein YgfZ [Phyllobacterium zundukense]